MSMEQFFVLRRPQLSRLLGVSQYLLKQEVAELEIQGRWDWYPELPRPLVILREQSSREVLQVVSANYTSASRTSVAFTLPPLIADRLLIELS